MSKRQINLRNCYTCDVEFKPLSNTSKQKFCSRKCFNKFQLTHENVLRRRKFVQCLNCGKNYEQRNYINSTYCSRKCYWEYRRKHPEIKFQSNQTDSRITKKCEFCDGEFKVHSYRKDRKFCTKKCETKSHYDYLVCPTCNAKFSAPKYEKRKYCCVECFTKGIEKRKSKFYTDVFQYLNKLYAIENEKYININNKKIYCDILILDKNIIVECNGDYWHCNPQIFSENYYHTKIHKFAHEIWENDKVRNELIQTLGYKIITIWEYDWNNDINFFNNLKQLIESI